MKSSLDIKIENARRRAEEERLANLPRSTNLPLPPTPSQAPAPGTTDAADHAGGSAGGDDSMQHKRQLPNALANASPIFKVLIESIMEYAGETAEEDDSMSDAIAIADIFDAKISRPTNSNENFWRDPIGLTPRAKVMEQRLRDIDQAIARYAAVGNAIPAQWECERLELLVLTTLPSETASCLPIHSAMVVLSAAIRTDPEYAQTWRDNVAEAYEQSAALWPSLHTLPELSAVLRRVAKSAADNLVGELASLASGS